MNARLCYPSTRTARALCLPFVSMYWEVINASALRGQTAIPTTPDASDPLSVNQTSPVRTTRCATDRRVFVTTRVCQPYAAPTLTVYP